MIGASVKYAHSLCSVRHRVYDGQRAEIAHSHRPPSRDCGLELDDLELCSQQLQQKAQRRHRYDLTFRFLRAVPILLDGARQNGSLRRQQKRSDDEKRGEAVLETEEVHCE